ncbi:unnamed protein product [Taenia asiatica]|uniref:cyclin-dependent kinase n=1 Tax=Taenia asiatica TaxID=60517 RepID=A0A0R3WF33_TAEAS|nr:unnamed protein product [Taenia asiatica]
MLQAPRYCHLRRIIYRDLMQQNVAIDVNKSVTKLADFGLPKFFGYSLLTLTHGIVVTLLYRSLSILLGEAVDCCSVDVWSIGCMFVEMTMGDSLFCGDSEIDKLFHTFLIKGIPTETTWSNVTKLPYYNPGWVPSYRVNGLCYQEKIMRELDARGLDLLTVTGSFASRFANLDERSLPAVGEEYVGLPIGRIPPDFSKLFGALITINESELSNTLPSCWLLKLRVMSSALLLGASTYQVSAAGDKFIKRKLKKSKTEEPPTDNHVVNRSTAKRFNIVIIINLTAHFSLPFYYANYLPAPGTVAIIAVLTVQQ